MLLLYPQFQSLNHESMLPTFVTVRHRPSLHVGCMAGSHSSYSNRHAKIYDHHCPVHICNYLQYLVMARPSHCIAKTGSLKVISILESIETPESVRLHAVADMRVLHEKGGGANRGCIMREIRE